MIDVNRALLKTMRYILSTSDLEFQDVENIMNLSQFFKGGGKKRIEGSALLMFMEPSTRTRLSFEKACYDLGLKVFRIDSSSSSMEKGESFEDTLKTVEALGMDVLIFRVPFSLVPYGSIVESTGMCLVNAGDGANQHPTQALIDLFTLRERFGDIKNLKIVYIGDILHSRVFRSSLPLLLMYGAEVGVCGPRTLIPPEVEKLGVSRVFDRVDEAIGWADVCVWLRLQKERQKEQFISSEKEYFLQFGLSSERYEKLKFFMHPGPVNRDVDIDGSLVYSEKSLILDQVKNGVFVRMAVLSYVLQSRTS